MASVLWVAAFLISILAAVNFYLGRNAERQRRIWTEEQLEKVTAAKEALEQEKEELGRAREALETQLSDATAQAKAVADDLAREKRAREALTTELAQARRDSTDLKGRLDQERKEKLTLTEDLAKAKQSYQALSNELTTLRQAKEALEKRVKEMLVAQASEAEKIVVKPATAAPSGPAPTAMGGPTLNPVKAGVEGKVLVVNREFNFVVVNLGSKDGLEVGTPLSILRAGKPVGKAQVERIYENMAAAAVLAEEQKAPPQEGDQVRVF